MYVGARAISKEKRTSVIDAKLSEKGFGRTGLFHQSVPDLRFQTCQDPRMRKPAVTLRREDAALHRGCLHGAQFESWITNA